MKYKYRLKFVRGYQDNMASSLNQSQAFEYIRDMIGSGWILVYIELE